MLAFASFLLASQNPVLLDAGKGAPVSMPRLALKPGLAAGRSLSPTALKNLVGADTEGVVSLGPGTGMIVAGRGSLSYDNPMYVDQHGGRFALKPGLDDAPSAMVVLKGLKKGAKYLVVLNTYGHGATTEMFLQEGDKQSEIKKTAADIPEDYGSVPLSFTAMGPEYTLVAFMEARPGAAQPYMHLWSVDVSRVKA